MKVDLRPVYEALAQWDNAIRVRHPYGGEHTLVRWAKDWDGWHLLLGGTPERTDALAVRLIAAHGDDFRYNTPQHIELVSPSAGWNAAQHTALFQSRVDQFTNNIIYRADQLRKLTGELHPSCELCDCTVNTPDLGGCVNCHGGIRLKSESPPALYLQRRDMVQERMDECHTDNMPAGLVSRARPAHPDETVWGAFTADFPSQDGTVLRELTTVELPMQDPPLFLFVMKGPVVLPELHLARQLYRAAKEEELQEKAREQRILEGGQSEHAAAQRAEAERVAAQQKEAQAKSLRAELAFWSGTEAK